MNLNKEKKKVVQNQTEIAKQQKNNKNREKKVVLNLVKVREVKKHLNL